MSNRINLLEEVVADEQVIIVSERYSLKKAIKFFLKAFLILLVIGGIFAAGGAIRHNALEEAVPTKKYETTDYYYVFGTRISYPSYEYRMDTSSDEYDKYQNSISGPVMGIGLVIMIVGGASLIIFAVLEFIEFSFKNAQLVITNKRSFGIRKFRKRVDLPLDSISAVSTLGKNALRISTSSGLILFSMIKNRDEMHKVITDLLVDRQKESKNKSVTEDEKTAETSSTQISDADELAKFKKLLDDGVITQEEFDAKKKQILRI